MLTAKEAKEETLKALDICRANNLIDAEKYIREAIAVGQFKYAIDINNLYDYLYCKVMLDQLGYKVEKESYQLIICWDR